MRITFIGDVHGHFTEFNSLIRLYKDSDYIIQVGDVGFGFPKTLQYSDIKFPDNVKFIRGNHDNPNICRKHPNYIGDYGYSSIMNLFYLSGAFSIDWMYRIQNVSVWGDEELSNNDFNKAAKLYFDSKPSIVVTHDCPKTIQIYLKSHHIEPSKTNTDLEYMFNEYKPKYWIFGHHHTYKNINILGTNFICLPELYAYTLDTEDMEK